MYVYRKKKENVNLKKKVYMFANENPKKIITVFRKVISNKSRNKFKKIGINIICFNIISQLCQDTIFCIRNKDHLDINK